MTREKQYYIIDVITIIFRHTAKKTREILTSFCQVAIRNNWFTAK